MRLDNWTISDEEYYRCVQLIEYIKNELTEFGFKDFIDAYWKDDKGKLHKKYIGKYPPSIDKHKSSDNDCASDTVIDPSDRTR